MLFTKVRVDVDGGITAVGAGGRERLTERESRSRAREKEQTVLIETVKERIRSFG